VKRFLAVAAVMVGLVTGLAMAQAQDNAASSGINGKWHFVLDTSGGDREIEAQFTVDADGKVTGTFGKDNAVGTFKDGKMDLGFQMTSEEAGETAQMKILGKLDDQGKLTGNWQFSSYDGSFKATRPAK
jgi:hypothetical protein